MINSIYQLDMQLTGQIFAGWPVWCCTQHLLDLSTCQPIMFRCR